MQVLQLTLKEYIGDLNLGITPFLLANLLVFLTSIIAIGSQSYKLTKVPLRMLCGWNEVVS